MRIVLDTNVIVSAALSPHAPPARIHEAWVQGRLELLVSPLLLVEYRRALAYDRVRERHQKSERQLDALVQDYELGGVLVDPDVSLSVITVDPDDNRVLECAVAGAATHIVSGDLHLLDLRVYQEIPILEPRAFIELLEDEALEDDPAAPKDR